jgi:hypothetical protein
MHLFSGSHCPLVPWLRRLARSPVGCAAAPVRTCVFALSFVQAPVANQSQTTTRCSRTPTQTTHKRRRRPPHAVCQRFWAIGGVPAVVRSWTFVLAVLAEAAGPTLVSRRQTEDRTHADQGNRPERGEGAIHNVVRRGSGRCFVCHEPSPPLLSESQQQLNVFHPSATATATTNARRTNEHEGVRDPFRVESCRSCAWGCMDRRNSVPRSRRLISVVVA